jgi:hypothetical protein
MELVLADRMITAGLRGNSRAPPLSRHRSLMIAVSRRSVRGARTRRALRSVLLGCSLVPVALAGAAARAATVKLHVQAPYDLAHQRFDLRQLETQNLAPLYHDAFSIPYPELQKKLAAELTKAVDQQLLFHIRCATIFCPDTDVAITVRASFAFTKDTQPVITAEGPAIDNTLKVQLDTQAAVGLSIEIHSDTGIWKSTDVGLEIQALLGIHAGATLTLWPTLDADDVTVALTHDGGNIDVVGLEGEAVEAGVKVGAVLAAGPGAIIGGILGKLVSDAAEKKIKAVVNEVVTAEIAKAGPMLTTAARKQIDPQIAAARDLRAEVMTTPIPGVDQSLQELMELAGLSLDVRTVTNSGNVHTVVTTRFAPQPQGRQLRGTIRFPKTQCVSAVNKSSTLGAIELPFAVEAINEDLAGKPCAGLVSATALRRAAYLGEDPEKLLASGDPSNHLASWTAIGSVSATGKLTDQGSHYECAYTISDLPDSSILELGVAAGSELATRLDAQAFHARFLYARVGPGPVLLDAVGKPLDPLALRLGGVGPTDVGECPAEFGSKGKTRPEGFDLPTRLDPQTCPMCGVLDVWSGLDARTRPGDITLVHRGARLEDVVGKAQAQADQQLVVRPLRRAGIKAGRGALRGAKAPAALPEVHVEIAVEGRRAKGRGR